MSKKNLTKKIMATAFAVAGLALTGGYAQASDYDNPTGIMKTINSATKHKTGLQYKKVAPRRLYVNRTPNFKNTSGGALTGFAAPTTPTIDYLNSKVPEFTSNHTGTPYNLTEIKGSHTHSVILNGTTYYYTPSESSQENNSILTYLVGANKLTTEGATSSNSVFTDGTNNYIFDKNNLPQSVFSYGSGNEDNYNVAYNDGITIVYKTVDLKPADMKTATSANNGALTWSEGKGGATWSDTTTFPKISDIIYPDYGYGTLTDNVTGAIRYKLSGNGDSTERYYNFSFTPNGSANYQETDLANNVTGGYFYGLTSSNAYDQGGAIYSGSFLADGKSITSDFIKNGAVYGGAIFNSRNLSSVIGNFIGNNVEGGSSARGGAILNSGGSISSVTGNFTGNSSTVDGGAIYNTGTVSSLTADFIGNNVYYGGGAIYNSNTANIGNIVGDFIGNSSASSSSESCGGAIFNAGNISSVTGNFISNSSSYSGGAVNNIGSISALNADFIGNSSNFGGGAILNTGTISTITGDFVGNSAQQQGGAIYNGGPSADIVSINGDFIGNSVSSSVSASGGAVYNYNDAVNISGTFTGNSAKTTSGTFGAYGGAIFNGLVSSNSVVYNADSKITLGDTVFKDNFVDNNGVVTPNSIYNAGIITIKNGATVTINDGYNTFKDINDSSKVGQLKVGTSENSGAVLNLNVNNGIIQTDNLGAVTNNGAIYWALDANLSTGDVDRVVVSSISNNIIINAINVLADAEGSSKEITLTGSYYSISDTINNNITYGTGVTNEYTVSYAGGKLTFNKVVPTVFTSLAEAVSATEPAIRTYDLSGNETVTADLGALGGTGAKLTVDGGENKYSVSGGSHKGITVASGQTLELKNLSGFGGFASADANGGAVNNAGSIEIGDGISFEGNSAVAGGAIYNAATGHIEIGDNAVFKDNTAEYNSGHGGGSDIKNFGYVEIGDNAQFIRTTYQDPISNDDVYDVSIFTMNGSETRIGNNATFKYIGQVLNNEGNTTHTIGDGATFEHNGSVITNFGGTYTIGDDATFKDTQFMTIANKGNNSSVTIGDNALFEGNKNPVFHLPEGDWVYMNGNGAVANNSSTNSTVTFGDGLIVRNNTSAGKGVIYNVASSTINFNGDATFTGNKSEDGAIYNLGIVNFKGNAAFSGSVNNADEAVSDIYNKGTLVFNNTSTENTNTVSAVISGDGSVKGNINKTGAGVVALEGSVSNQTITVSDGELFLDSAKITLADTTVGVNSGAIINTIDGVINNYTTGGGIITLSDGAKFKGDLNYTLGVADIYNAADNASIIYQVANVLDIPDFIYGEAKEIQVANGTNVSVNAGTLTWTGNKNHGLSVTSSANSGCVTVTGTAGGINAAVDNTSESGATIIDYSVIADEHFNPDGTGNNNVIEKSTFSITGDGVVPGTNHQIILDNDMIVNGDSTLNLENVIFSGTKTLTNRAGGHLNIKNSLIGVAINNAGIFVSDPNTYTARHTNSDTSTYNGDTFTGINSTGLNGGAIYNTSTGNLTVQKEIVTDPITGDETVYKPTFENNIGRYGGAIYSEGLISVSDAVFTGNSAEASGAIRTKAAYPSTLTLTNSTFTGNYASENGAIGLFDKSGISTVTNSTFTKNYTTFNTEDAYTSDKEGGGAISLGAESLVRISGSTFLNNYSTLEGGAITTRTTAQSNANAKVDITNSTFTGNKAGVLYNALSDTTSASNYASTHGFGGAIYNNAWHNNTNTEAYVLISNSTFTSNEAYSGGAIYNDAATDKVGSLNITGTTFTSNSASANGGAIYNAGQVVINGGSFTDNIAEGLGGAIYSSANLKINADDTNGSVTFSGNKQAYVSGTSYTANDIYMDGSASSTPIELVLKSKVVGTDEYNITLGSGVDGVNYNINVNEERNGKVSVASLTGVNTILLQGGELDLTSDTSAATLSVTEAAILNASSANGLEVGTLTVGNGKNFTNSGNLKVTSTLTNGISTNKGTISNTGTLILTGSDMTNVGTITSTSAGGNLNITGTSSANAKLTNNGTITGNNITISQFATLNTLADAITDKDGSIANNGTLELKGADSTTGSVFANSVNASDTGHTDIIGGLVKITDTTKAINQAINIKTSGILEAADAVSIGGTVTNDVANGLVLKGGNLAQNVVSTTGITTGTTKIDGTVTINDASNYIAQGINIVSGSLTANAGSIKGAVDNAVTGGSTGLVLTGGTLVAGSNITGTGATDIGTTSTPASVINNALISTPITIQSTSTLTTAGSNNATATSATSGVTGTIANAGGTLNVTSGYIVSAITGANGTANIKGNVTVKDSTAIANAIVIDGTNQLTTNADNIDGGVTNAGGTLELTGGKLETAVSGGAGGTTKITGTVENASTITNSAVVAGTGTLTNPGTISGSLTNNGGTVYNYKTVSGTTTNGTITGNIINASGTIETKASYIATTTTSATPIQNDGTLKLTGGTISKAISEYSTANAGTVEIAGDVALASTGSISNNIIKLSSGTFDVTGIADTTSGNEGNIDLTGATKIVANGGTLNVQDGETGLISLGAVDTATNDKNLNVAIDADFMHNTTTNDRGIVGNADVITATSLTEGANNSKIHVSDINLVLGTSETNTHPIGTEFTVQVASGAVAQAAMDFTGTTVTSYRTGAGSILLDYDSTTGYLTGRHASLTEAVTSSIDTKMFFMDNGVADTDTAIGELTLYSGTTLSVSGNNHSITSNATTNKSQKGITLADANQYLKITDAVLGSSTNGFSTAIDNTNGGKVELVNITTVATDGTAYNTTDVLNNGEGTKGVFIAGTSNMGKITYYGTDAAGQTTIGNDDGVTDSLTIGEISQKNVNILSDGVLNIAADKLQTTAGTNNSGIANVSGSALTAAASNLGSDITSTDNKGTVNLSGNIATGNKSITGQGSVKVGNNGTGDVPAKLTVSSGTSLTTSAAGSESGNVDVTAGNTLALANGSTTTVAGALAVATGGTLDITGTPVSFTAANGVQITDGSLNLHDATLNTAIAGAGTSGVDVNVDGAGTTSVSAAITNAINPVEVESGATLALNDNGSVTDSTGKGTDIQLKADTSGANGANFAVNNTDTANAKTLDNKVTAVAGAGSEVTVNSGTGAVGTVVLDTVLENVNKVNVANGTAQIGTNTDTKTKTSDTIGGATLNVSGGATATIAASTTPAAANSYTIDNNVTGSGNLDLNGNSGTPKSSSEVGTEFNIASGTTITDAQVNLNAGQLNIGDGSAFLGTSSVSVAADSTINAMDGTPSDISTPIAFAADSEVKADVDAVSGAADKFLNADETALVAGNHEYLTDLSIKGIEQLAQNSKTINLTSGIGLANLSPTDDLVANLENKYTSVLTPIRKMNARVQVTDDGQLLLNFVGTGNSYDDFNSAVMASPIAAQVGGYLTQLHSYDEAFRNMDMYMLSTKAERQAMKMRNKYATTSSDLIYDPTVTQYERKAGWFRPYATFESVPLSGGPDVSNVAYGTYAGGDSEIYDLGHGWDGMWGVYVGYNGSHQAYGSGNSIYQNGGTLGLVGMAYKGDFFTGLTVNVGANGAEASTMYGSENFSMLMAGIASKTGYNWELAKGKFIIQPSVLASYSFVDTFDYKNAAGVNINADPLHAVQIEPGVKFIGNLKNGWQPYAGVSVVINIMDKTDFHANDVSLPDLSVKPFVKYGVGIRKSWGERFTAFFQTYFTSGGRNGVGLQTGLRWTIGKSSSKKSSSSESLYKTEINTKHQVK